MMDALAIYRQRFRPSETLDRPHVMLGINVVAAESDEDARHLFSSHQQAFVNLRRGTPGPLPPPDDRFTGTLAPHERAEIDHTLSVTAIGSTDTVHAAIAALVARTGADELIMVSQIYDHAARLRSYELTAALRDRVASQTANALRQG